MTELQTDQPVRHALFQGEQSDPFATFENVYPDADAAMAAARKLENSGMFCAIVPLGVDAASYLTADPE